jgi:hypothetical protein
MEFSGRLFVRDYQYFDGGLHWPDTQALHADNADAKT